MAGPPRSIYISTARRRRLTYPLIAAAAIVAAVLAQLLGSAL